MSAPITGDWVLAVDLGTSYTVAAIRLDAGPPEVVDIGGDRRVPSVVLADDDGSMIVGRAAEGLAEAFPERTLRAPKTRIGEPTPVVLGSRPFPIVDLIGELLRYVYAAAVERVGSAPREVRLTHPATWNRPRLGQFAEAAVMAGLPNPLLVPEPVAAAVAYAEAKGVGNGEHVAVYDLGGGTFDTAILQATESGFAVVGRPGGDQTIGGELFDEVLVNHLGERLEAPVWEQLQVSDDQLWQKAAAALRREARRVKEMLSSHPYAEVLVGLPNGLVQQRVTRDELDALLLPYLTESVEVLERTIADAGVRAEELDAVYLVGGASRMPIVERLVTEAFPETPVSRWGDPKSVVALGATSTRATPSQFAITAPLRATAAPGTTEERSEPSSPVGSLASPPATAPPSIDGGPRTPPPPPLTAPVPDETAGTVAAGTVNAGSVVEATLAAPVAPTAPRTGPVPQAAVQPAQEPPTAVPPTAVPPTAVPPTAVPPTAVQPAVVPPTAVPPTTVPPPAVPVLPAGPGEGRRRSGLVLALVGAAVLVLVAVAVVALFGVGVGEVVPTTVPETTVAPTTAAETTAPTSPAPDTAAPQTPAPETPAPETPAPETPAPETSAPETSAPDTAAPTTAPRADTTPPPLTLAQPRNGDVVRQASVNVVGTTEPGASVTVNGQSARVGSDGRWAVTIGLAPGNNSLTIEARDRAGNASPAIVVALTYEVPTTPPAAPTTVATTAPFVAADVQISRPAGVPDGYQILLDELLRGQPAGSAVVPFPAPVNTAAGGRLTPFACPAACVIYTPPSTRPLTDSFRFTLRAADGRTAEGTARITLT